MRYIILLAIIAVAIAADAEKETKEAQAELKPEESALPIRVHEDERGYRFEDGLELIRSRDHHQQMQFNNYRDRLHDNLRDGRQGPERVNLKDVDHTGPLILRSPDPLPHYGHPDIEKQNRIIADVYSPDYYQPTWILDYRYVKSGGRDYTRSPGGQVLILPRGVKTNEHKEFPDFDSLLEHLRLTRLSEHAKYGGRGYGDDHDARRDYHNMNLGLYDRGHQQNWWKGNRRH